MAMVCPSSGCVTAPATGAGLATSVRNQAQSHGVKCLRPMPCTWPHVAGTRTPVRCVQTMAARKGHPGPLVVSFGEMLIDMVPTESGMALAEVPAFKPAPGGAPANVAVGVARLGGQAAFIGKTGDDEFGHMLAHLLADNGVNTEGVVFDEGARTALAFVTLKADGEREFMFYRNPSADMLLTPEELRVELISRATIFHYGSISLIAEPCKGAHLAALEVAKEKGTFLSYDANLRLPLWPSAEAAKEGILSIWNQADLIKVSDEELSFLTGLDGHSDEAARNLFRGRAKLFLVTEGSSGCRYYTKDFQGRVESVKVTAVDATGAGDAFVAAFLTALAENPAIFEKEEPLREALAFANAAGAMTTLGRGAIPSLPDRDSVLRFMQEHHLT